MTRKRALRVPEYLQHILDAIDRATSYVTDMDVKAFEADTRTQDAVLHSLQYPELPWDLIYGTRNRIVHDYFEVDLEVVWRTIKQDLPSLRQRVFAALPESSD